MDWIKTRYDRFILLLAAIALLAVAVILTLRALAFPSQFEVPPVAPQSKIPQPDQEIIAAAEARLANPEKWTRDPQKEGSLLVSRPYIERNDQLIDPTLPDSPPLHPPVDNVWLIDNSQPIQDPTVLQQDNDGDGFNTLEEWEAKSEPDDEASHPEYTTKLFFSRVIPHPFRLRFNAVASKGVFQIDARDARQPTQFLTVGESIAGSEYKITEHRPLTVPDPTIGERAADELTIQNDKGESVVLVLQKDTNVGKDEVEFLYRWKGEERIVRLVGQTFTLKPEDKVEYRVNAIAPDQATITRLTDNKEYVIKKP